jgi:hypothetical protein
MSAEQAIDHIMRAEGCSRRSARRKMARAIKDNKLPIREEFGPGPVELEPKTASQMLMDEPDRLCISLASLMRHCGYTAAELLAELRAGRLIARATDSVMIKMELEMLEHQVSLRSSVKGLSPHDFWVTATGIIEWVCNSETPPDLVAKYYRRVH